MASLILEDLFIKKIKTVLVHTAQLTVHLLLKANL